jgi:hypothetical protein
MDNVYPDDVESVEAVRADLAAVRTLSRGSGASRPVRSSRRGGRPRRQPPVPDRCTLRSRWHGNGVRQLPRRMRRFPPATDGHRTVRTCLRGCGRAGRRPAPMTIHGWTVSWRLPSVASGFVRRSEYRSSWRDGCARTGSEAATLKEGQQPGSRSDDATVWPRIES